jgi:histidyl-tRNA synthetase
LQGFQMRVGHLGVLHAILDGFGLSERAKLFVIGNVRALKGASFDAAVLVQQAEDVGLLRPAFRSAAADALPHSGTDETRGFIQGVLTEAVVGPMGRRTKDEIVERLLRKTREADVPEKLVEALELVSELVQVEGSPLDALERARAVLLAHGLSTAAFDDLGELFAAPAVRGIDDSRLVLDLGLARGISYYTGVVFELAHPSSVGMLGGGGRYDGLVRALGGEDVAALGFAYDMERVVDAMDQDRTKASKTPRKTEN